MVSFACTVCQSFYDRMEAYNKRHTLLQEQYRVAKAEYDFGNSLWTPMCPPKEPPHYAGLGLQKEALEHIQKCAYHKKHEGNGTYSGPFAFTLTKSPSDNLSVGDMLKAVEKIMNQKSCPVAQYAWHLEYKGVDQDGLPAHPHIHGMYETHSQGRIEAKHFKRAWPIWKESVSLGQGFRGGYHRPVKAEEKYTEYIKKDGGIGKCMIKEDPSDSL